MNKGFTLVELLAVIVILAIILAIAVPAIGNLIANSKKSMFENSSKMILRSMKNDYDGKIASTGLFTDTFILYDNGVRTVYPSSNTLDFTISATDGGIVRHSDGTVTFALYDGTNCSVKTRYSNDITVTTTDKATCINNIIYKQTTAPFNSILVNGDFSDGTTGWGVGYASISASNKVMKITGTGASVYPQISQYTLTPYVNGQKIYLKSNAKVTNSSSTAITYMTAANGMVTVSNTIAANPIMNYVYNNSAIMISNPGGTGNLGVYIYHRYPDSATASGKTLEVQDFIALNLTSIYGAGNEPTKDQMDNNINKVWIDTSAANTPKRFTAAGWINY